MIAPTTLSPTTLSMVARALRTHIAANTEIQEMNVLLGHPASVQLVNETDPHLSVFFYSVYPAANSADLRPEEPLDTIVRCIMTPLAKNPTNGANQISSGEEDLRILGQVITCMHGWRLLLVNDMNEKPVCSVEIIPLELNADKLSKIVPTQPEGGFRPTIAYELSLIPLFPKKDPPVESEVKVVTYGVSPDMKDEKNFPQQYIRAVIKANQDLGEDDPWKPQLYLIDENGRQSFFRQAVTGQDKKEFTLLALGPEKGTDLIADEKKLDISAEYWSPESGSFTVKKEDTITLEDPTDDLNSYHAKFKWELETHLTGQYLFRVTRSFDSPEDIHGNLCLLVIVRRESI